MSSDHQEPYLLALLWGCQRGAQHSPSPSPGLRMGWGNTPATPLCL